MKKLIALLLALVMVMSLFAGCAKTDAPAADAPAADAPAADAPATDAPAAETPDWQKEHPTWLCEEKTTLTVFSFDTDSSAVLPVSNDLDFWKFLEEYTNVHIEWNTIPNADYGEVVQARMAAGEFLGDIVNTYNLDNAYTGGQNGLFVDMGPYYETCFPYTRAWMAENDVNMENHWVNPDGSMYAISAVWNAQQNHVMGLWNTAWLEKLGLEVPDTLDEFTEVLYAMKEAGDLNENGEDDEVIITTVDYSLVFDLFNSAFGVEIGNRDSAASSFSVDENGEVFFVPSSENAKEMYAYMNQLYTDGILDPEIFSHNWDWDTISERAANERAGVMILWSSFAPVYGRLTARGTADPMSENYSISMGLKSEYNNNNPILISNSTPGYGYAVSAESENAELAMKWMDVVMAEPTVLEYRCWGVEGEDYEKVDGKNQLILPEDGSAWDIKDRGCLQVTVAHIQTNDQLVNPDSAYTWYVEDYAAYLASGTVAETKMPSVSAYTAEERELIDIYSTDITDYVNEMRAKFITGEADLEKDWDTYCATLESLGVNDLAVAYESIYNRLQ